MSDWFCSFHFAGISHEKSHYRQCFHKKVYGQVGVSHYDTWCRRPGGSCPRAGLPSSMCCVMRRCSNGRGADSCPGTHTCGFGQKHNSPWTPWASGNPQMSCSSPLALPSQQQHNMGMFVSVRQPEHSSQVYLAAHLLRAISHCSTHSVFYFSIADAESYSTL